jgi:DNA-binding MarR family transcriptional regulator
MHLVAERDTTPDAADALGDAVIALVRAYRHALRHPVASALPALELALLLAEGEHRLGELAARRGVCQSVVSRQVGELEARGLVVRRRDPADRRAGLVALTPAGRKLLAEAAETRRTWVHDALAHHHPDDDVRAAARLVQALADELEHRTATDTTTPLKRTRS